MLTVEMDVARVERRLGLGALECPGCSGVLAGWVTPVAAVFGTAMVQCGWCVDGRAALGVV